MVVAHSGPRPVQMFHQKRGHGNLAVIRDRGRSRPGISTRPETYSTSSPECWWCGRYLLEFHNLRGRESYPGSANDCAVSKAKMGKRRHCGRSYMSGSSTVSELPTMCNYNLLTLSVHCNADLRCCLHLSHSAMAHNMGHAAE